MVGTGTAAEIIGDARVSVVETGAWAAAFAALEAAGLPVALAGRALRIPGATSAGVRHALGPVPPASRPGLGRPARAWQPAAGPAPYCRIRVMCLGSRRGT